MFVLEEKKASVMGDTDLGYWLGDGRAEISQRNELKKDEKNLY